MSYTHKKKTQCPWSVCVYACVCVYTNETKQREQSSNQSPCVRLDTAPNNCLTDRKKQHSHTEEKRQKLKLFQWRSLFSIWSLNKLLIKADCGGMEVYFASVWAIMTLKNSIYYHICVISCMQWSVFNLACTFFFAFDSPHLHPICLSRSSNLVWNSDDVFILMRTRNVTARWKIPATSTRRWSRFFFSQQHAIIQS